MPKQVKVGDYVMWRGDFGMAAPRRAKVTGLEVTERSREKYGEEVESVDWSLVRQNRVLFTLDNESWAYSEQISPVR